MTQESSALGSHGGDDNRRNRAARLLTAHDIPEVTGRALLAVGDALRASAVRLQVEHAASFDIDTGEAAGPLQTGRATEVDIRRQTAAMRADRRYVSMHTHRTSAAFSDLDVDVLLRNSPIKTIIVVGHDGTWYVLSKRPGARLATPETGVAAFRTAFATLSADYLALVRAGRFTREEAFRDAFHRIWQIIARPLGLRYDRISEEA